MSMKTAWLPLALGLALGLAAPLTAVAAPAATLSSLDPDSYFKGKTGGTFGKDASKVLPGSKRVAVTGFRVIFVTGNTIKAQVRASYFGGVDRSGANASMAVDLNGVDAVALQEITDKAYANFLEQLRLAGREVVPTSEFQDFLGGLEVTQQPYVKQVTQGYGKQTGMAYSPAGVPLWFSNWDMPWGDKGPFAQKNIRSQAALSEKLGAITVAPLIVVDFAQMSSSGNRSGFLARDAEVGATLALSVNAFNTNLTRAEKTHSGIVTKGDDAGVSLTQPFVSNLGFGDIREVAKQDNSAAKSIFDALGKGMGLANAGGAASSRSSNIAVTNNQAYSEAALDALGMATGTFAGWFAKHPAP